MPSYLSPGVYMEEVDKGTKPIEAVGTAVAAFIGFTEKASEEVEVVVDGKKQKQKVSLLNKPVLVTNWTQYREKFGDFVAGAYTPDAVYGYFNNGGSIAYIVSVKTINEAEDPAQAKPAEISVPTPDKKGSLRFVAKNAGPNGNNITVDVQPVAPAGAESDSPTGAAPSPTEFNVVIKVGGIVRETYPNLTVAKGDNNVATKLQQSQLVTVEVVGKTDVVPSAGVYSLTGGEVKTKEITLKDYEGDVSKRIGLGGLEPLEDITMISVPDLYTDWTDTPDNRKKVQAVQQRIIDYCELVRYCFAILDAPPGLTPQQVLAWRNEVNYDTSRAALYYPWIETADMTGNNGKTRKVPPSGLMAGIYARVDNTRGVHKAPANEIVRGALGLEIQVTKGEQDLMNPKGINCIRSFPGRGIRVWGARTLSSDASWRYISVRRLFNQIEESIERGTQWVVFEPNDPFLWGRVTRDVKAFLRTIWRTGALFGPTPEAAFYVKCDAETNPVELRDLGQLVCEIGIAPVKPAEFVIFRISQWSGPEA